VHVFGEVLAALGSRRVSHPQRLRGLDLLGGGRTARALQDLRAGHHFAAHPV